MKKNIILLLLIFIHHCGYTQTRYQQKVDSLKQALTTTQTDSAKSNLLIQLLGVYTQYKPDEGIRYKEIALQVAANTNQKIKLAKTNDKIGRIYWKLGKFSQAYQYHFTALDLYNKTGDIQSRNYVMVEIGQDYLNDVKFSEANKYLLQALQLSEQSGDKRNMFNAYDKLIALYENEGNFVEASKATYANLKICEELGDTTLLVYAKTSYASNLQKQANYAEALQYFNETLVLSEVLKDELNQTVIYNAKGEIYLALGNFAESEKNYAAGIQIAKGMENSFGVLTYLYRGIGNMYRAKQNYPLALKYLLNSAIELRPTASNHTLANLYAEIGTVYTKLFKYNLAKTYFDSSMVLCKKLNTKINFESYYSGRQLLDSATGNWKAAYEDYKQYKSVKDSSFNTEVLRKMVTTQMQYENEKVAAVLKTTQEKKDIVAQSEINRQRNIRNSAFASLAVLLLFLFVVYIQRNKIAKEKKRSDVLLKDNELLLKEIHHRVKNNLEVVSSLLELQSDQISDPNIKSLMQEGQNRVHSIGIVHQQLYQGKNLAAIEMKDYFIHLSKSIAETFGAEKRVLIECVMDTLEVDIDTAVPLGLIVNELLTNTFKYAFPHGANGHVQIKLQKRADGILVLEVSDNGVGKTTLTHGTGFGSQLITLLTQQLNGTIIEEVNNGMHTYFEFKSVKIA